MLTVYIVSLVSCLMFGHAFKNDPNSAYAQELANEYEYNVKRTNRIAFIPVVNTLVATALSVSFYIFMYEQGKK